MGINFNPTILFVCRLCRCSFPNTEVFKEHKLACHFGDCMGIKCIIFEERLTAAYANHDHDNEILLEECENKTHLIDYGSARDSSFKNPYNTLARLGEEETKNVSLSKNNSRNKRPRELDDDEGIALNKISSYEQRQENFRKEKHRVQNSSESQSSQRTSNEWKLQHAEHSDDNYESRSLYNEHNGFKTSSSKDEANFQEDIQIKKESFIYEVLTSENLVGNEGAHTKMEDVDIAEPEHNEEMANDESTFNTNNDCNSNLTTGEFERNHVQHPEQQFGESTQRQHQQSVTVTALNLNSKSKTATDESIDKPFVCETCSASFIRKDKLTTHMLCHSSIRPFKCSKCPSEFKRKDHLSRHQLVHGVESTFKCRFCHKFCRHRRELEEHERSHSGNRFFKCPVPTCGYAAVRKDTLTAHARAKHKELGP